MSTYEPFDVNTISCSPPLSAHIMTARQDINRMVALIGNITFYDYFTKPVGDIAKIIAENLTAIPDTGGPVFRSRDSILERLKMLFDRQANFKDVLSGRDADRALETVLVLDSLRTLGVLLPMHAGTDADRNARVAALNQLLASDEAGKLTYQAIFVTAKSDVATATKLAVHAALDTALLPPSKNGCCLRSGGGCQYMGDPQYNCNLVTTPTGTTAYSIASGDVSCPVYSTSM